MTGEFFFNYLGKVYRVYEESEEKARTKLSVQYNISRNDQIQRIEVETIYLYKKVGK